MITNTDRARKGFTLTELLVVMSIIIILLSMLVVCVDGIFTYATRMQCQHHMEQLWTACLMYSNKHRILPNAWDYDHGHPWYAMLATNGYLDSAEVYNCPSSDLVSTYGTGSTTVSGPSSSETMEAIHKTLNWMKDTQRGDGTWYDDGWRDVGQAGLGLLAFLGAGCTTTQPEKYADTVEKALAYVINCTQANGDIIPRIHDNGKTYAYGIVLMALCDAYSLMGDITPNGANKSVLQTAQLIFDYLDGQVNQLGALPEFTSSANDIYADYDGNWANVSQHRDNSTTCWAYQGIKAADRVGLGIGGFADRFNTYAVESLCVNLKRCTICGSYVNRSADTCANAHSGSFQNENDRYYVQYMFDLYHPSLGKRRGSDTWDLLSGQGGSSPNRQTAASFLVRQLMGHGLSEDPPNPADRTYSHGENAYNMLQWMRAGDKHIQFASGASGYDLYYIYYATLAFWTAGGSYWNEWANGNDSGFDGYIEELISRMTDAGQSADGPMGYYWPPSISCYYNGYGGRIYPTALATISMEVSVGNYIPGSKYNTSTAGAHSYGYNNLIANDENGRRRPAGDTIVIMDYTLSGIDPTDAPAECIAPRHGGKVNVFFGDGHTEALTFGELTEEKPDSPGEYRIKSHMLSLQGGSDPVPVVEEP